MEEAAARADLSGALRLAPSLNATPKSFVKVLGQFFVPKFTLALDDARADCLCIRRQTLMHGEKQSLEQGGLRLSTEIQAMPLPLTIISENRCDAPRSRDHERASTCQSTLNRRTDCRRPAQQRSLLPCNQKDEAFEGIGEKWSGR